MSKLKQLSSLCCGAVWNIINKHIAPNLVKTIQAILHVHAVDITFKIITF